MFLSVTELNERAISAGVNTPIGSLDVITTEGGKEAVGFGVGVGPSLGADIHVNKTYTKAM